MSGEDVLLGVLSMEESDKRRRIKREKVRRFVRKISKE